LMGGPFALGSERFIGAGDWGLGAGRAQALGHVETATSSPDSFVLSP
jgi:hypothetical protein